MSIMLLKKTNIHTTLLFNGWNHFTFKTCNPYLFEYTNSLFFPHYNCMSLFHLSITFNRQKQINVVITLTWWLIETWIKWTTNYCFHKSKHWIEIEKENKSKNIAEQLAIHKIAWIVRSSLEKNWSEIILTIKNMCITFHR